MIMLPTIQVPPLPSVLDIKIEPIRKFHIIKPPEPGELLAHGHGATSDIPRRYLGFLDLTDLINVSCCCKAAHEVTEQARATAKEHSCQQLVGKMFERAVQTDKQYIFETALLTSMISKT
jgi:hypothetical protein